MLQITDICKQYKTGNFIQKALNHVSLNLRDNEFVSILGPSGSGKTTLLNIIGGLDRYDSGDLIINGISTKKYKDRDWDSYRNHTIGFVFQSYNLIPHQTILSNVELALTISGVSKAQRREKAIDALTKVGLGQQIHKKPNQLSGGQMQRVAIARALVNDPNILLADEPTGALDSETSIQVMDLLKEVAKDRLVVMVTHNPKLAKEYATRIVTLKDGVILDDTNPYHVKSFVPQHRNMGKTSMSLLTSLSLSFNNLKTKKGRTFLTSFAGSIGIIGIALILSLSNGVNTYIQTIEEDTLSEYPLQITSTGIDMSSMLVDDSQDKKQSSKNDIQVANMMTTMFSKIGSNDLESLKSYIQSNQKQLKNYSNAIEYTYNVTPQIYRYQDNTYRQVNPDKTFSSLGMGSSTSSNNMMSSMMSTDVFKSIPKNTNLFSGQYDMKAGHWPKKYNECVVVLTSSGKISDMMAYTLGLRDSSELDQMVQQFANEEDVDVTLKEDDYSYQDILNKTFKLVKSADYYEYDEQYHVYKDKSNDQTYMNQLVQNGEDLKIVGIVQPKDDQTATMLSTGIYYPSSLVQHIIEKSSTTQIVQDQIKNKNVNIFTGNAFEEKNSQFDLSSLFTIDQNKMQSALKFNTQALQLDFTNLNQELTNLSLPTLDMNQIINQIQFNVSSDQLDHLANSLLNGYLEYEKNHPEVNINQATQEFINYLQTDHARQVIEEQVKKFIEDGIDQNEMQQIINAVLDDYKKQLGANDLDITKINEYLMSYLNSQEAKNILTQEMTSIIQSTNIETQISQIMSQYMQLSMQNLSSSLQRGIQKRMMSM
ncbi:MAG: ABC transporter ATP-binding protein, partial [Faecalibacillus sp.]